MAGFLTLIMKMEDMAGFLTLIMKGRYGRFLNSDNERKIWQVS